MRRDEMTLGTLGAAAFQYPLLITLFALGGLGAGIVLSGKLSQFLLPAR
jgi:hypothetical protein